ncbi:AMP-binding protein [Tuberibacillus sp. Marseille-P3662]|uniref:AMP-binding protein n=1 Tax=Tuberibacillus sp. Marseille-P3662 TaxID=1965358 RepID=UPI000A1CB348|nr:AMP-binding protein [Tuberibacillus sp. Marseille-P3662]
MAGTIYLSTFQSINDVKHLKDHMASDVTFAIDQHLQSKVDLDSVLTYDITQPKSLKKVQEHIESGYSVVMFPENQPREWETPGKYYPAIFASIAPYLDRVKPVIVEKGSVTSELPLWQPGSEIADDSDQLARSFYFYIQDQRFKLRYRPGSYNFFNELVAQGKANPKRTAMMDQSSTLSYRDSLLQVYGLAEALRPVLKEQRVGLLLPTSVPHALALFGLFYLQKTPVMLNFTMGETTLTECCETAEVGTILTSRAFIKQANLSSVASGLEKHVKLVYLEDIKQSITTTHKVKAGYLYATKAGVDNVSEPELVLFTSGTDSRPKGVILTHSNIYANITQALTTVDIDETNKVLNVLPMFHSFGLTAGTLMPFVMNIPVYLHPSPLDYKVIPEIVYQHQITVFFATSTFLNGYAKYADSLDMRSLQLVVAGGEKLKDEVYNRYLEQFQVQIFEGYGMTESAPIIALGAPRNNKRGTVGQLLPGIQHEIRPVDGIKDGGSLFVKGPNIMKGYLLYNKGFVPAEEWVDTGDVVRIDDEGYVHIISRLKRFAKIGGEMISLTLVEQLAMECFESSEVATIAVPDQRKGEKIILFTTNADHALKDLKQYIKSEKHPAIVIPKEIEIIDDIPVMGSGKTDYGALKQIYLNRK